MSRPEKRRFALGALAAKIDADRAGFRPRTVMEQGRRRRQPRTDSFTRAHVESLRVAGASKADVADYATAAGFSDEQVAALVSDLDSYGEWAD